MKQAGMELDEDVLVELPFGMCPCAQNIKYGPHSVAISTKLFKIVRDEEFVHLLGGTADWFSVCVNHEKFYHHAGFESRDK